MSLTETDRMIIEPRIAELVRERAGVPALSGEDGAMAADGARVMDEVVAQAVASSEGGKRLRALLTLAAFDSLDGDAVLRQAMVDLACGIEVFQTAALVHDDIIDDSDLRRGKPSAHRALEQAVGSRSIGNGLGLMLGDILATASVDIVHQAVRDLPSGGDLVAAFLEMHREVEVGQVLDLAVETSPLDDPEKLAQASLNVFRWKTASYTTIAPLRFAMLAVGMPADQAREHAMAIGLPLGLAFQLADDLLDVIGVSAATGKPIGGDIREGKRTVLLADALAAAGDAQRDELLAIFTSSQRNQTQVDRVIALFDETGAIERSRERIAALWAQSRQAIGRLALHDEAEDRLLAACRDFIPESLR
ncbi:polyprenyl synthetase family protein [Bifidobacterium eulemuris]|uniref:Polyprenyl synthetase family protein n=1 Tax=Bifidobacterium eulemuris TaxID=1765219 RepID=A0A261G7W2_9BIFI|nr:polyprenyl synthetase family protein [Bifidobacterium eulemuris]OZG67512.1 serralysin [Bifidobacterium eulemuris]QOL31052.1 polyprenyl synthetase family protein [Bifidobacterium eulemuris]